MAESREDAQRAYEALDLALETKRVTEALRFAVGALEWIAQDAGTLPAARSTAEGAILGVRKELERSTAEVVSAVRVDGEQDR